MPRDIITLACTECKRRNYTTTKNRRNTPGRLEMSKFCRYDKRHTLHRETRWGPALPLSRSVALRNGSP